MKNTLSLLLVVGSLLIATLQAASAADRDLSCKLTFSSKEWSALYASAVGQGTVTCKDGSSMPVAISAKGLGITAGKWRIIDGKGTFTHVANINDVIGSYLSVSGDIGVSKAGTARALTKGNVSLVLAGKGEGFDVGIAISDFKISKAAEAAKPTAEPAKPAKSK